MITKNERGTPQLRSTLLDQRPVAELRDGLLRSEPIVYTNNGNRTSDPEAFLERISRIAPLVGVRRLAEITHLANNTVPVFQSCRPSLFHHSMAGQNSGGQGKGSTQTQAKISCLMETIEQFCQEPRNPQLIRGSYAYLSNQYALLDPKRLEFVAGEQTPSHEEALVWTPAYSVELDCEVLIPAETTYFPFIPSQFGIESRFPSCTSGVAAGATYLEAVIHSLYEHIESYYQRGLQERLLRIDEILVDDLSIQGFEEVAQSLGHDHRLRLYALRLPHRRNVPMLMAYVVGSDGRIFGGVGCCASLDIAVTRAISEALQSWATVMSGSREDIPKPAPRIPEEEHAGQGGAADSTQTRPLYPKISLGEYREEIEDLHFDDLQTEFRWIVDWLHELGFRKVCIANLTRTGIDLPVVKALVPRLPRNKAYKVPSAFTLDGVIAARYGMESTR